MRVVGRIYADLHVPTLPQLPTLTAYVDKWRAGLVDLPRIAPIPRRMIEHSLSLLSDFASDANTVGTLIHANLHYSTVVANEDGNWVAIDPQPLNGDPHFELAPMLWNRFGELEGDVRDGVRRRFHTLVDSADLDEDRARHWVIVRTIMGIASQLLDPAQGALDEVWLTTCISVTKAVQD